ncbi:multicopper oxidase family protein [Agromyces silvae]|uniref:multicopper oxidase family protein n=1 Tax=Agromyces silvae TaxID=3388266 RepID=UPI00280C3C4C|nr:multicopper oxidase domain-containing protein [Agromyces protaetiae]
MTPRRGELTRRGFLAGATGAAAVLALAGCGPFGFRAPVNTVGRVDFRNPLHIPPLAESVQDGGARVFDLVAQAGRSAIVPSGTAETWGINGPLLGPTLRAHRGEQVRIRFRNDLPVPTTLHWHGMHLPAVADGGPHQMVAPGETWEPGWKVAQPAASLWYHPHPHGETEIHVYRGMAGLFILDDDDEAALPLPRTYGVDDIPLIVQDKTFDASGGLIETGRGNIGMLGDTILVNGTLAPVLDLTAERTRLRILNGSTARSYAFGFSDDRGFHLIATDGGLLREPVPVRRVTLTPGERAEIVLAATGGESITLRSFPQDLGLSGGAADMAGANDELDLLLLRAAATLTPSAQLPAHLAEIAPLTPPHELDWRKFDLRGVQINGKTMDMARIDTVVELDTTEVWEVRNSDGQPHNFHVHDVQFQILDLDDAAPPPELSGWKDTVYLPPGRRVRLIMRFTDYADPAVPYMYHCHLLWHEDLGMMGQFVVVEPGQAPVAPGPETGHAH